MPVIPPPSRKMISSAKRCAISRAWLRWPLRCIACRRPAATAVLHVVEPALNAQRMPACAPGCRRRACWRSAERSSHSIYFLGPPGTCQADKSSGKPCRKCRPLVEIVPQRDVERYGQVLRAGIAVTSFEIGNGDANFLHPEPGSSMNPVLARVMRRGRQEMKYEQRTHCVSF